MRVRWALWMALGTALGAASACAAVTPEPLPLEAGRWALSIEPQAGAAKRPPRKVQLQRELCPQVDPWFERYPSRSPIARAGCRFTRLADEPSAFRAKTECALQRGGVGVASLDVEFEGRRAFTGRWSVTEPGRATHLETVRGIWVAACRG